jgi:uncharacterized membrane protein
MFAFIILVLILAVAIISFAAAKANDDFLAGLIAALLAIVPALLIAAFSSRLVGVCRDVSETEMIGYVANVSYGGAVWQTVEVNVYIDKNTSSVSYDFSSSDKSFYETLKKLSGKKIKIKSKDSWVLPWSEGSSKRRIISVEEVVEGVEQ